MNRMEHILRKIRATAVLDHSIGLHKYTPIDLSVQNLELSNFDIKEPISCQEYVDTVCRQNKALVAYGGYLEKRNLYQGNTNFAEIEAMPRTIHLGMDFWAKAGTPVVAPISGRVHSFKNNAQKGDYGPTIILEHQIMAFRFYSLYGHLALASLEQLHIGKEMAQGTTIGSLGTSDINVHYAPHLHFQLILDMEGKKGDYPGVSSEDTMDYYKRNCPDPNSIFKLP